MELIKQAMILRIENVVPDSTGIGNAARAID